MSIILNIDTAADTAYVSLAKDGEVLLELSNNDLKDHGAFLQPAIHTLLKNTSISIRKLDAIAISAGPGSYTGLRVGMASAKGLCYALNKPLITLSTLEILAFAAILKAGNENIVSPHLFCPMIDARRMEIYTALYNSNLEIVLEPCAMILEKSSFANTLLKYTVLFFGNGAKKWEPNCNHQNGIFLTVLNNPLAMSKLSHKKYELSDFADLAYSEPFYLKEFFGGSIPL
ncbi:MAG: tRNA (adenosine(37)-N6)-threonylcarbamoyltransferase complex dimerization subunit type 1 TsaB [Ferruginibacter sp.]|nr:tRNA (adenosine(37)-N6)-threonylcarbamoyltransferase complex dimerization subunit type 1 TsaB [Ferruginibacter sp.]